MVYDRYETLRIELDARGVATVILNRPDKHNALNAALIYDLCEAAQAVLTDRFLERKYPDWPRQFELAAAKMNAPSPSSTEEE